MENIQLAFDVSYQQLRGQKEDLRHIRNQASIGAAISGLIASVFASLLGEGGMTAYNLAPFFFGIGLSLWLVLLTFSASIAFAILAVLDWRKCVFELSPLWILKENENSRSYAHILDQLAKDADMYFDDNEVVMKAARQHLWFALVFGWAQILAWLNLIF